MRITRKGYWRVRKGSSYLSQHVTSDEAFESASRNLPCEVEPPRFDCAYDHSLSTRGTRSLMSLTLDTTTRAEYVAGSTVDARAQAFVSALVGTVTVKVYDGSDVERATGTITTNPWASAISGTVTVGEVSAFTVSNGGTPDSTWYVKISNGTRWVRGSFGVQGASTDFVWSAATFVTGQTGDLGTIVFIAPSFTTLTAPANTALPTVVGTPTVGSPLYSTPGTWTGNPTPSLAYQWLLDGAIVSGATGAIYTPVTGDIGKAPSVRVTATNSQGSAQATSAEAADVVAATVTTVTPSSALHENTISVTSGTLASLPVYFGEVFKQGEISQYPQAVVNGTAVTTQADVLQRWSDGSVRHAVLTFYIPASQTATSTTLTFQNQSSGNTSGGLSQAAMTAGSYATLDQTIAVSGQGSLSLRSLIQAGQFSRIRDGSICTEIHVVDYVGTATRIGGFRAQWYVRFWPAIGKAEVRFVGGMDVMNAADDLTATFSLAGPSAYTYSKTFTWYGGQRFTKRGLWFGTAPAEVHVRRPMEYLRSTGFAPPLDPSPDVAAAASAYASTAYAAWTAAAKDWSDAGTMNKAMGAGGGRPEIGLTTQHVSAWLVTGDYRYLEHARGNADLAGAWQKNWIEGRSGLFMDRAQTIPAIGKPPGLKANPTWIAYGESQSASGTDGPRASAGVFYNSWIRVSTNGWAYCPGTHKPDFFSWLYVFTGDDYYLRCLQSWACYQALQPGLGNNEFGWRSAGDYSGAAFVAARAWAWTLRERVMAHACSPDSDPMEPYFQQLVDDMLAMMEGIAGISGTSYDGHAAKVFGAARSGNQPLNVTLRAFFAATTATYINVGQTITLDTSKLATGFGGHMALAPFMEAFLRTSVFMAREFGYSAAAISQWLSPLWINPNQDVNGNPEWLGLTLMPGERASTYNGGGEISSTSEMHEYITAPNNNLATVSSVFSGHRSNQAEQNYVAVAFAASADVTSYTNGQTARDWWNTNARSAVLLGMTPHWAITPKTESALSRTARSLSPGSWSSNLASSAPSLNAVDSSNRTPLNARNLSILDSAVHWSNCARWDAATRSAVIACAAASGAQIATASALVRFSEIGNRFSAKYDPYNGARMGHGYDNTAIDVTRRRIYKKCFAFGEGGYADGHILVWSADTLEPLAPISPGSRFGFGKSVAMEYMPTWGNHGSLIFTDPGNIQRYDIETGAWSVVSTTTLHGDVGMAIYLPNLDRLLFGGGAAPGGVSGNTKFYLLAPGGAITQLDDAPVSISCYETTLSEHKAVLLPHPDGLRAIAFKGGDRYTLNPSASAGAQWSTATAIPAAVSGMSRTFGFTVPELGICCLAQEAWSYGIPNEFYAFKP